MDAELDRAAQLLRDARRAVAFTGAGVSTESGIPDFRSPGGLWDEFDPDEFSYQRFVSSAAAREKMWRWGLTIYPALRTAEPNPGHTALAALEQAGRLRCVITQNIDDLHRRAGSRQIIELHGNAMRVGCLGCGAECAREELHARLAAGDYDPRCDACGGILKSKTISFGQAMPEPETSNAFAEAQACDLMIVLGSSLVVYPAASLVPTAVQAGARLIVVNLTETPFDYLADVVIRAKSGEAMAGIYTRLGLGS